jgi:transcriptional regulator with XRE-family HTH domain
MSLRIKKAIARVGITQRALSIFLGVHPSTVSRWARQGAPDDRKDVRAFLRRVSKYAPKAKLTQKQLERRKRFYLREFRKPSVFLPPSSRFDTLPLSDTPRAGGAQEFETTYADFLALVINLSIDRVVSHAQVYLDGELIFSGTVKQLIEQRPLINREVREHFREDDKEGYYRVEHRSAQVDGQTIVLNL